MKLTVVLLGRELLFVELGGWSVKDSDDPRGKSDLSGTPGMHADRAVPFGDPDTTTFGFGRGVEYSG